ncbi:MAG: cytochrome b [Proteobacteria bacterium]|nr:cytochrome b [Pseudomonadota bacterium]
MEKYTLSMRIMHWIMAILIISLLCVGLYIANTEPHDEEWRNILLMHKSFGILALLLVMLRLAIRLGSYVPELPPQINHRDVALHNWTVFFLYVFMFVMPIAGYVMSIAHGNTVEFFGMPLPALIEKNTQVASIAHTIHVNAWYFLIGLIVLHLAGNTKHYIVEKVNLLQRIW